MRFKILGIFFFFSALTVSAQDGAQLTFTGKLLMNDFSSIDYRLNFTLEEIGSFSGISSKDIFIETPKSYSTTGFLDIQSSKISFMELNTVSRKSDFETENECFVHVSNASLSIIENKAIIQGVFRSQTPEGDICYKGKINLVAPLSVYAKAKLLKEDPPFYKEKEFENLDSLLLNTPLKRTLTKDSVEELEISRGSETIVLELWDIEVEDGDVIDIFLNNTLFKKDFEIKKKRQGLIVEMNQNSLNIKLTAKNTGLIFPNTVSIFVISKDNVYYLETKLKKEESASIVIKRMKE